VGSDRFRGLVKGGNLSFARSRTDNLDGEKSLSFMPLMLYSIQNFYKGADNGKRIKTSH